jgi:hypothetical protein
LTGHVAATQICQAVSSNEEAIWFGAAQGLSCELVAAFANPAELQYEKTANTSAINASVTTAPQRGAGRANFRSPARLASLADRSL